ncbi:MAG TPA: hypothetical protein VER78_01890, partial [Thermoanaerobaculia bacterium]|nr:hypothetical protein [Thermoanaerobaculia bacterium]
MAVFLLTSAFFLRGVFLALALPYGDPLDEPFHYGYASYLATTCLVPRAGVASMPADALRPMARLPRSTSFGGPHPSWKDFASETPRERAADREEAFAFRPGERAAFVTANYETQQPPLAYLPAAGILRLFPRAALDRRLALLRLFSALAAASAVPLVWLFFRRLLARSAALAATAAFVAFPGVG